MDGVVATNTTIGRSAVQGMRHAEETGGLSGAPVLEPSNKVIRLLRATLGNGFPIIGVGGILSAEDALSKIRAGADVVQIYTGLIYEGPALVPPRNCINSGRTTPAQRTRRRGPATAAPAATKARARGWSFAKASARWARGSAAFIAACWRASSRSCCRSWRRARRRWRWAAMRSRSWPLRSAMLWGVSGRLGSVTTAP
jgi:tRNA-dihydrouridine synthase